MAFFDLFNFRNHNNAVGNSKFPNGNGIGDNWTFARNDRYALMRWGFFRNIERSSKDLRGRTVVEDSHVGTFWNMKRAAWYWATQWFIKFLDGFAFMEETVTAMNERIDSTK